MASKLPPRKGSIGDDASSSERSRPRGPRTSRAASRDRPERVDAPKLESCVLCPNSLAEGRLEPICDLPCLICAECLASSTVQALLRQSQQRGRCPVCPGKMLDISMLFTMPGEQPEKRVEDMRKRA